MLTEKMLRIARNGGHDIVDAREISESEISSRNFFIIDVYMLETKIEEDLRFWLQLLKKHGHYTKSAN